MSKPVSAGFIIFRRSERNLIEYLLLQGPSGKNDWTPPKGHLNPGESALEAAQRETEEEAGLYRHDLEYYHGFEERISYVADGKPKIVFYYLARIRNSAKPIKLSTGHRNVGWLNLQDACQSVKHLETGIILRKAENFIKIYEQESINNCLRN